MTVLTSAAGLADVPSFGLDRDGDRLLVGNLRPTDVRIDAELAHHAVDDDFEVKLAHAVDQRLTGLLVGANPEGRILFGQAGERSAHLVLVGASLRLDRDRDDRLREGDRLEHDRVRRIAQRVAGERTLQTDDRADVAGADRLDFFAVVGVHLEQATDPLAVTLGRVQRIAAGLEDAGVDPDIGQLADVRVGLNLEDQTRERLTRLDRANLFFVGLRIDAGDRRNVERRRQVVDDRVEHLLNALVLQGAAAEHRHQRAVERRGAKRRAKLVRRENSSSSR